MSNATDQAGPAEGQEGENSHTPYMFIQNDINEKSRKTILSVKDAI